MTDAYQRRENRKMRRTLEDASYHAREAADGFRRAAGHAADLAVTLRKIREKREATNAA